MTGEVEVEFQICDARLGSDFPSPEYATAASAGMDLRAMIDAPMLLEPGESVLVPSGIALYLGNASICAVILPRSGLGHRHGLVLGNLVGLIDADYQGPLMISLWNRSSTTHALQPGDRVAQLVLLPVLRARLKAVEAFSATARGAGGFGHTGVG